jgi:predicted DNA-binding WGR domain protein
MPRYELIDAKSSKFWEIERNDAALTITYGKIGTDGRTEEKSFDDATAAEKAYAKLVAEKTKKGYVLAGSARPEEASTDGRPRGVPAEAWWSESSGEWELGPKDADGKLHGEVSWWRPDGTLCCRTDLVHGVPHGKFRRFHENGELSREGTFEHGKIVGLEAWQRSHKPTTEYFGDYWATKKVWRMELDHTTYEKRFFTKDGVRCDAKGKLLEVREAVAADAPEVTIPAHWAAPLASPPPGDPWIAEELPTENVRGVWWSPALRRATFPRRGGVTIPTRPLPPLADAWSALRRALLANDAAILEHERSKNAAARSGLWTAFVSPDPIERAFAERVFDPAPRVGDVEADVDLVERSFARYRGALLFPSYADETYDRLTDFLVASVGLGEAGARLLLGLDDELPYQRQGPFERLRELLALADEATYADARAKILAGYEAALAKAKKKSYVGRTPAHLAWAASFVLPLGPNAGDEERSLASKALSNCKGRGFGNDEINAGGLAMVDLAGLQRFLDTNPRIRSEFFGGGARLYLASVLDLEGEKVAKVLATMKPSEPFDDDERYNGRWCFLLAHLDSDDALTTIYREHAAGHAWGTRALALAVTFQAERVARIGRVAGDASLLAKLDGVAPLTIASERADVDARAIPSVYVPPVTTRPKVRATRLSVPVQIAWREHESEAALSHAPADDAVTWDGASLRALSAEALEAWIAHRERWAIPSTIRDCALAKLTLHPRLVALGFSISSYECRYTLGFALAANEEGLLPLLELALDEAFEESAAWAMPFGATSLAPAMIAAFSGKKHKAIGRAWMLRHPRHAWASAFDLRNDKTTRDAAERALRYLASQGHRAAMLEDAAAIGELDAVRAILDLDPLAAPKAKLPTLPKFSKNLPTLTRGGVTLDAKATEALLVRLAASNADEVHPAVTEARESLDRDSAAAFVWALFEAWLAAGADPKQTWCMQAVGFLGDDACARKLAALAKDWPGQKASARAQAALDALLAIGSETALVHIHLLAEKSKFPAFQAAAAERIARIAEARGLSPDELADRLVPRLGLDEEGALQLDFGARTFVVSFDEQLAPIVRDASGKVLTSLPKPSKTDDAALAKAAAARFSALKKDARTTASLQIARLERAMCTERTIARDVFLEHFVAHPWMLHLTRRLVWAIVNDDGASTIGATFRVAEDGSLATIDDETFVVPEGARVLIPHAARLDEATRTRWSAVLADYELLQPFAQLARPVATPTDAEARATTLTRFSGRKVPPGALRGMRARGWSPWVDSWITTIEKSFPRVGATGGGSTGGGSTRVGAALSFEPGYSPAGEEAETQALGHVELQGLASFAELGPVRFSELVRDLETLGAS